MYVCTVVWCVVYNFSSADGPFVLVVLADECSSQSNITVFLKVSNLGSSVCKETQSYGIFICNYCCMYSILLHAVHTYVYSVIF